MPISSEIIALIFGGGGVALLTALGKLISDFRHGKVVKEESAVAYYKDRISDLAAENRELEQHLIAYRSAYAEMWRVYRIGPPPGQIDFPFDPTIKEKD